MEQFWGKRGASQSHCNQWELCGVVCRERWRRGSSHITLGVHVSVHMAFSVCNLSYSDKVSNY